MQIKFLDDGTKVLVADEGMKLTDGINYGVEFMLGDGRSEDEYTEITEAEYNVMQEVIE